MANTSQNYKNHTRWFPLFHFVVMPILLINFLNSIRHLYLAPSRSTGWGVVVALAFVLLGLSARLMALSVQDRLIKLEMRLRLAGILPPDLQSRFSDLTREQLVALRFASDAEMPSLVREVLAGSLNSQKAIKLKIKDWQGDYLRC